MAAPGAGPARLLLDEMFTPRIAKELRVRGIDCRAVTAEPALRALDDADVLEEALADDRVLVTNNVGDFETLRRRWVAEERPVPELLYTSDRSFPRDRRFVDRLVTALHRAASTNATRSHGGVCWLEPAEGTK